MNYSSRWLECAQVAAVAHNTRLLRGSSPGPATALPHPLGYKDLPPPTIQSCSQSRTEVRRGSTTSPVAMLLGLFNRRAGGCFLKARIQFVPRERETRRERDGFPKFPLSHMLNNSIHMKAKQGASQGNRPTPGFIWQNQRNISCKA